MLHMRLVELRNKAGLSQSEFAERMNISRQAYSLYEINKRQMNYDTLCMVADFYEVSTDYLLGRQDSMPSFLSDDERVLVDQYRLLDKRGQESVKSTLAFEVTQAVKPAPSQKSAM